MRAWGGGGIRLGKIGPFRLNLSLVRFVGKRKKKRPPRKSGL